MALYVMDQLAEFGEVRRGTLGISVQDLTDDLAGAFDLEFGQGVLVAEVAKESAADEAGLRAGDVIRSIAAYPVSNAQEFHNYEGQFPVGKTLELEIIRKQSVKRLEVKVLELQSLDGGMIDPRLEGARFEELPLKQRTDRVRGVLLSALEPQSRLARLGLRPGDIVKGCNQMRTQDLGEFQDVVSSISGRLFLQIHRNGEDYRVRVD